MIEHVVLGGVLRALIVRRDFHQPGIHFFTPAEFSQQLGYMAHPAGHRIAPHTHLDVPGQVRATQEVLMVRRGRIRVDFYGDDKVLIESRTLSAGDVVLLVVGGHGFEVLDDCEMFEIRPGPYAEGEDKVRFTPAALKRDGAA